MTKSTKVKQTDLKSYLEGNIDAIFKERAKSRKEIVENFAAKDNPRGYNFEEEDVGKLIIEYFTSRLECKQEHESGYNFEFRDEHGGAYGVTYTFLSRDNPLSRYLGDRFFVTVNDITSRLRLSAK